MTGLSNHFDAMSALEAMIIALQLPLMSNAPVIQAVLDYKIPDIVSPVVLIGPIGVESFDDPGLNDQENVDYPIGLAIVSDVDNAAISLERVLSWRQKVRRRLRNANLLQWGPTLTTNYNLNVKPAAVIDRQAYNKDRKYVSGFVIDVYFQEPRS